jgi:hypothetical protein
LTRLATALRYRVDPSASGVRPLNGAGFYFEGLTPRGPDAGFATIARAAGRYLRIERDAALQATSVIDGAAAIAQIQS